MKRRYGIPVVVLIFAIGGVLVYSALMPCPYTPLGSTPDTVIDCNWWDLACRRCS